MEIGAYAAGLYRVLRRLGEGGTAHVYLAVHRRTLNVFALKEIPLRGEWPRGELDYARHLFHPGLPVIHDLFEEGGCVYVVMDYIEGTTLKELKAERGNFSMRELLDWMIQLTEILNYLHSRVPPLIHGDIKPSNLMLDQSGQLILLDFGACLVEGRRREGCYGTISYASPEQRKGNVEPDFRSDLYSMGKTFSFLAGTLGNRRLEKVFERCLRENREERYLSDRELLRCLRRIQKRGRYCCVLCSFAALSFLIFGSFRRISAGWRNIEEEYQCALKSGQSNQLISAIKSFPGRGDAYQELLHVFLIDQDFSWEESQAFEELMAEQGEVFQNEESYSLFCYDLGIAYWYYYQGQGSKSYARFWFERAKEEAADAAMAERAMIYQVLGEYCEKKAKRELTGEGNFSWEGFLSSIEACCRMNQEGSSQKLKEKLQEELLTMVYDSLLKFKEEGAKRERIEELLKNIQTLAPEALKLQFELTEERMKIMFGDESE